MSSRFKGKLCLHLRAKELTIFRDSFIWQLTVWAWAWAGVAGRWARRHAAPAVVGRFIFFSRLGLFWRFGTLGFWASRTTDDGRRRNRAPPLKPPGSSNRKSPNFYRQFFFQKKIWRQIFLAILKFAFLAGFVILKLSSLEGNSGASAAGCPLLWNALYSGNLVRSPAESAVSTEVGRSEVLGI